MTVHVDPPSRQALDRLADRLRETLGPAAVRSAEPLAHYTTLRVGGPADLLAIALSGEALRQAVGLAWAHGVPCQVLGSGSNILVGDAGMRGLVVLNRARAVHVTRTIARAESGASFAALARQCVVRGLAGLEWASGIPGTVGGAVYRQCRRVGRRRGFDAGAGNHPGTGWLCNRLAGGAVRVRLPDEHPQAVGDAVGRGAGSRVCGTPGRQGGATGAGGRDFDPAQGKPAAWGVVRVCFQESTGRLCRAADRGGRA